MLKAVIKFSVIIPLFVSLCLTSSHLFAKNYGILHTYRFKNANNHYIEFTVRFPDDYIIPKKEKFEEYEEYGYIDYDANSRSIISIKVTQIEQDKIDMYLKKINGDWHDELLKMFWEDTLKETPGIVYNKPTYFKGNPAIDLRVIPTPPGANSPFFEIESQMVVYNDNIISLVCCSMTKDPLNNKHRKLDSRFCKSFFNSLTFNN